MPYTPTVTALAAAKRATAGNTLVAEWGAAAEADIDYLSANYLHKDGTVAATGADFAFGAGINISGGTLKVGGTSVIDASRNAINLAGLSADATARKLIVEIANHRYKLFNYINSYSVPNGASTLGTTVWTTSPLPGTFRGANIIVIPQAQTNAALFEALPFAVNGSSYNIDFQNGTGGPVVVDIYVEATCTQ